MIEEKEKKKIKKIKGIGWRMVIFPLIMIYFEYYFRMSLYEEVSSSGIYPFLFAVVTGVFIAMLTCIFRNKGNRIVSYVCVTGATILYIAQIIYHGIFGTFFGFSSFRGAGDAMDFKGEVIQSLKNEYAYILGLLEPLFVFVICSIFLLSFERPEKKKNILGCTTLAIALVGSIFSLNIEGRQLLTPYNLFHGNFIINLSMKRLGLPVTMTRDVQIKIFGGGNLQQLEFNEDYITIEDRDEYGYEPQVDESLDLKKIYDNTDDQDKKTITAYISNKEPTYKNEYTGLYQGYNLIYINAESLSKYVIREDWTPVLYRMMNDGYRFTNYYQPTWNKSTIDAEYTNCLSQYPSSNKWSLYESASTYQPYALGNELTKKGYTCKAYHDYDFFYYDRSKTHPNMGYDFKAIGYGLELPSQDLYYSDLEMMEETYDEFTSKEPFHAYFMTYSGHLPYEYAGNAISEKNRKEAERLTEGLPFNDTVRAYIAAQLELEYALEFLIDKLETDGLLNHTLFVISPDHFPYELRNGDYNVLAQEDVLDSSFETYHTELGIWNSCMKEPVTVDKICSGVDILPTVLNLMGVDYDSRLLAGHDIFSDQEGYAVFDDYSYITPYVEYDGENNTIKPLNGVTDQAKLESVIDLNDIDYMFRISYKMLETDYFDYIYNKCEKK